LNLGLRYEYATPWVERDNILSNWDPDTRTMVLARDGSLQDRSTIKPDRNNFGPRLGLAYSLTPTTIVRGGYGISYVHFHRAGGANVLPINGPQVINAVVVQTLAQADFRTTEQGYPAGLTDPSRFNPLASNITFMPENYHSKNPQRQLPGAPGLQQSRGRLRAVGLSPALHQHDELRPGRAGRPGPCVFERCVGAGRRGPRRLAGRRHQQRLRG
jgi:hypothetical protein